MHWGSHIVPADRDRSSVGGSGVAVGGVTQPAVGEGRVAQSVVTQPSIGQVLRLSLGRSLAVVVRVGSQHPLSHGIQALGHGVQSSARTEGNSGAIAESMGVSVASSNPGVREGSSQPGVWMGGSEILSLG